MPFPLVYDLKVTGKASFDLTSSGYGPRQYVSLTGGTDYPEDIDPNLELRTLQVLFTTAHGALFNIGDVIKITIEPGP